MKTKKHIILPKFLKMFEQLGENIKLARKRRKLTTIQVSERAGIDRTTLYHIEKGNPSVSIGAYFNVLRVLNLHEDFLKLAADDELGRKLQDLKLLGKQSS
ncbi:helix-turn-helix domain-containing protein [Dyadobacter sp. Leaf189]|uniref:helix-turn-helix domain-containing protein n=1 Tax=Dyadobacter sp. Leaf189 TaxID=1736295 RepID=UPI0006FD3FA1|nr:helix-turn-helix transcriptional regulator [Dyadobacter sp. Leaf189]KQS32892.1 XRE family transcriptional regulator [Dyadobacter sp. Leaf189]